MLTVQELRDAKIMTSESVLMVIDRELEKCRLVSLARKELGVTTIAFTPEAFVEKFCGIEPITCGQRIADETSAVAELARTDMVVVMPGAEHRDLGSVLAVFRAAGSVVHHSCEKINSNRSKNSTKQSNIARQFPGAADRSFRNGTLRHY